MTTNMDITNITHKLMKKFVSDSNSFGNFTDNCFTYHFLKSIDPNIRKDWYDNMMDNEGTTLGVDHVFLRALEECWEQPRNSAKTNDDVFIECCEMIIRRFSVGSEETKLIKLIDRIKPY